MNEKEDSASNDSIKKVSIAVDEATREDEQSIIVSSDDFANHQMGIMAATP